MTMDAGYLHRSGYKFAVVHDCRCTRERGRSEKRTHNLQQSYNTRVGENDTHGKLVSCIFPRVSEKNFQKGKKKIKDWSVLAGLLKYIFQLARFLQHCAETQMRISGSLFKTTNFNQTSE